MTTIGNRVWFDVNCNGHQDSDETGGPEGVKVTLTTCSGGISFETYTDATGHYQFHVPVGAYVICVDIPEGYAASPEDAVTHDRFDSDVNSEGCTACKFYRCDRTNNSRDAGLCEKKGETEGCSPGYWRNHLEAWAATPYSPDDKVNATFGCDLVDDDNLTLGECIDAPETYGTLVFHAIAALLNATHPDVDFDLDAGDVIDAACTGDKDTLAAENEKVCPLSVGETTGDESGTISN
ncbi:MAG TPA: SdrD B-like domain-containing protein [Candidatus Krumholzibacteria bacterium]